MRTFEHFPHDDICPVCNTNEDEECLLVPIDGTEDENLIQAIPIHTRCLGKFADKFKFNKKVGVIYLPVDEE